MSFISSALSGKKKLKPLDLLKFAGGIILFHLTFTMIGSLLPSSKAQVSVPIVPVYYYRNDGSEKAGGIGIELAILNPKEGRRHTFVALLNSRTIPTVTSTVATAAGVDQYQPVGADYIVPIKMVGLSGTFSTPLLISDHKPNQVPISLFTRYYNLKFVGDNVVFTQKFWMWGI